MGSLSVVTGAHGFLGRHAARHLSRQGWDVIGLGHGNWPYSEWRAWGLREWHACDVTLETLLVYGKEPDLIVHCAGSASVGFSMMHPLQDYRRTVETTANLLEYVRLHAPKARVVYPSSAGVYGVAERMPIMEDAPLRPLSVYGDHKRLAEELCRSFGRHFGVSGIIVRFFSVYGPELRKQLLWDACNKMRRNETTFPGTGDETRDWLHVKDAAALCQHAGERTSADWPVANGGSGHAVSVKDVLNVLWQEFERHDGPTFSGVSRAGDPKHYQAEVSLAKSWGWVPDVDWRAGVREYVEWFRAEVG
jgi:UDP-glucose 4-epimerase